MNLDLTTCAVVYGEKDVAAPVSRVWIDAALALLSDQNLPVREYEINQTSTSAQAIYKWTLDRDRLFREVSSGQIRELGLYAHSEAKEDLAGGWWEGLVYINLNRSYVFVGVPATSRVHSTELLGISYQLASCIAPDPFRYGIAYQWPSYNGPEYYAVGVAAQRTADPRECLAPEVRRQLSMWRYHFLMTNSYLRGWFRDVYRANLLSEEHVEAIFQARNTLESVGLGQVSQFGQGRWLWEVSDEEIPEARAALREAKLLICV